MQYSMHARHCVKVRMHWTVRGRACCISLLTRGYAKWVRQRTADRGRMVPAADGLGQCASYSGCSSALLLQKTCRCSLLHIRQVALVKSDVAKGDLMSSDLLISQQDVLARMVVDFPER